MRFALGFLLGLAVGALLVRQYVLSNKGVQLCQQASNLYDQIKAEL